MKRLLVTGAFVVLAVLGSGGTVLAQSDQASDRACVGAFVNGWIETLAPNHFGPLVSYWATDLLKPFGQRAVSPSATTCDFAR